MGAKLRVIQGDWVGSPDWLDFPRTITGRSPHDRERFCEFRVARSDVLKAGGARRRQPAYDFWSVLAGQVPPVPGSALMTEHGDQDLTRLIDAHACFQGIERPCGEDDRGDRHVAFVLRPKVMFAYEARPPAQFLRRQEVPPGLVFVAFARLDEPSGAATNAGVITHWQLVEADDSEPTLPTGFGNRFYTRLW